MIRAKNLSVSFGEKIIIDNANFFIKKGEKVGIIGDNGSGKTTLLKCIAKMQEYEGEIIIKKGVKIGYQEQDNNFPVESNLISEYEKVFSKIIDIERKLKTFENNINDENSYKEYIELLEKYENSNRNLYRKKIKSVALGLGFKENDFKKPFKYFSGGEIVKAAIGKAILSEPDILLLDEPSNHLDIDSIEWLERFIHSISATVIMVSHDKYFLSRVVNKIIEIEFKKIYQYNGNYDKYIIEKENRIISLKREQKNLSKEIKRNEEIIRKLRSYGREKHMKQAHSREKKLYNLKKNIVNIEKKKSIKIDMSTSINTAKDVLIVSNLEKYFEKLLFKNVSFKLHKGEKVGLIGPNGSGKSTLLKMIIEKQKYNKYSKEIIIGYNVKIGYYDQKLRILDEENDVFKNLWVEIPTVEEYKIRKILSHYLFMEEDVFKKVKELSGGEKARLAFAKILIHKPNFLILDEPTNHLDIASREIITHALTEFNGSILLVSHDRFLLDNVCKKTLVLTKTGVRKYDGNFTYYYNKQYENESKEIKFNAEHKNGKIIYEKRKELKRIETKIKRKNEELLKIEKEIEKTESEIDRLYGDIENYTKIDSEIKKKKELENSYLLLLEEIEEFKSNYEKLKKEYDNIN